MRRTVGENRDSDDASRSAEKGQAGEREGKESALGPSLPLAKTKLRFPDSLYLRARPEGPRQ